MTEMPMRKGLSTRIGQPGLFPSTQIAEEDLALLPNDKDVLVSAKAPRNIKQHRLAWALAEKVAQSVDFLHDRDDAMEWLKIKSRHVRMLVHPVTGEVAVIPKSIAFASCTQQQFSRIFNRMVYVTITEIIPGLEEGALRQELEAMTGGSQ